MHSPTRWSFSHQVWVLFGLALALRLLHLLEARHAPYYATLILDAEEYQHLAQALLAGSWARAAAATYVHGMLYPAVWALVEGLFGGVLALYLLQAVLGAATCALLACYARRLLPPLGALLCGLLAAVYWPFIVFGGQLLATTLVLFLAVALLALLSGAEGGGRRVAVASGGLLALLGATRANALLLAPVVVAFLCRWAARTGRSKRRTAALIGSGLAVGLAPVVVLNVATQGTPVPFEGAWSFYMGNNPEADGTPYVRQGIDWQRLEAVRYRHGVDAADERGRIYLTEGLRYLAGRPVEGLHLLYRKLRLFWNAFEVPVSVDLAWYDRNTRLGQVLPGYGLLAPLALVGMACNLPRWRDWGLAYGGVLAFLVSGLLFTVCARYRLPAVPFLMLFAADALVRAADVVRGRDLRRGLPLGLGLVAAVLWVHTGVDVAAADHLRPAWLQGGVFLRNGDPRRAEVSFLTAAAAHPADPDVRNSLGAARERLGRLAAAEADYRQALTLAPDLSRAALNLGSLLGRTGRRTEAEEAIRQALTADPRPNIQQEGMIALGYLRLAAGQPRAALAEFDRALAVRDSPQVRYVLSMACRQLGRRDEELTHLERVVELDPGIAAAHQRLGTIYQRRGRTGLAHEAFERARRAAAGSL
jgi:Tfp pilus assembly protein PilF